LETVKPIEVSGNQLTLRIQVQPRSSSVKWGSLVDNQWIQLRITSPPVDGAANKMCLKVIGKRFKTARSNIRITRGEKSRYKTVVAEGCDPDRLKAFLDDYPIT